MNSRANTLTLEQQQACADAQAWLARVLPKGAHLSSDSRKVGAGDAFVAYAFDAKNDGRPHIEKAIDNGASAVLWQADEPEFEWVRQDSTAQFGVKDLNVCSGHIAHAYYGEPSSRMSMVALTGTNGKTSSAQWIAQLLTAVHQPCAMMGTLGVGFVDDMQETGFTTPQAIEVHRWLAHVQTKGAQAVAMEVSSHALEQGRVNGVAFDVALFTNLTRDHLDYHGSMLAYEAAKTKLFTWQGLKSAVINTDDEAGRRMAQIAQSHGIYVIGYGLSSAPVFVDAYLQALDVDQSGADTRFTLRHGDKQYDIRSGIVGEFNVMNLLGVLGVLLALGHDLSIVAPLCADIKAAPGRMQRFGGEQTPLAVVDFAHTPDALEKTLTALRPIAQARGGALVCVFGCGGDRDPGKRPQMGEIAARIADRVVVTSDNPRTEEPSAIVAAVAAGTQSGQAQVAVEIERRMAIDRAIQDARSQDVILVAGKGHEAYQDIMGVKHPYSDLEQVQQAIQKWSLEKRV
ncbi:UDP-N-acetylmuramoyl-L-alanyl-D-glutamate--2,6-diaminopimelate ligase [Hydromonas duriensis]|uniref:UDP-N-acetylmuramoyl-L-alanyl-D-glutamate--2,6-diaminopimelate ligase n=1 Tax=Hydromonas duriensis TaxID=1527608 RepID=A0A4R6Y6P0_9BURK|nr:UDP-N-acetylmuramoyl-L-alanyl-D-glutamate--2,6-diaminopimelate ligase [Hydromonas duriensis]TDR30832.1 UDP-N-acetylmuramoylalanyl-D-glutamate--2,6-diaminopimelate ligase [Hydromonas duriensis]